MKLISTLCIAIFLHAQHLKSENIENPHSDDIYKMLLSEIEDSLTQQSKWSNSVNKIFSSTTSNCTLEIPHPLREFFMKTDPPHDMKIPEEHLVVCLLKNQIIPNHYPPFLLNHKDYKLMTYSFGINQMVSLDFNGLLTLKITAVFKWIDFRFRWDHENYTIGKWKWPEEIVFRADKIWTPTFILADCEVDDCLLRANNKTYVYVNSTGLVSLYINVLIQGSCDIEPDFFPFDYQHCNLTFIHSHDTNFTLKKEHTIELDHMYDNEEWIISRVLSSPLIPLMFHNLIEEKENDGKWLKSTKRKYSPSFEITLELSRHGEFYVKHLIIPVLAITVSVTVSSVLPSGSDKANLAATALLAFIYFQDMTSDLTPKSDRSPLIVKFIQWEVIFSVLILAGVIATMIISQNKTPIKSILQYFQVKAFTFKKLLPNNQKNVPKTLNEMRCGDKINLNFDVVGINVNNIEQPSQTHENNQDLAKERSLSWEKIANYADLIIKIINLIGNIIVFALYLLPVMIAALLHDEGYIIKK